ncbi:MAG TPA: hypothetical protein VFZ25_06140 [Chloroflexota bacterium]|nr:hypothetical protein [Chloroflexota bacterium]
MIVVRGSRQRPLSRRALVVGAILVAALLLVGALALWHLPRPHISVLFPARPVAYTFVAGHLAKIDPTSGVILTRSAEQYGDQFPSLAVSHDGGALFLLHAAVVNGQTSDQLIILSAATLAPAASVSVEHFMSSMDAWPPALAVTSDDRTVVVYQYGDNENSPFWLSYYDRASSRFLADQTILPACGVAQLLPVGEQLAVLCFGTGQVYLVNLATHHVSATVQLDLPSGDAIGLPVAAASIPDQNAIVVVESHGRLFRVDLTTHAVSLITSLVTTDGQFAPVVAAAFSDNGRVAVSVATNKDDASAGQARDLLIADTSDGRLLEEVPVLSRYTLTMAPDGRRVFLRGDSNTLYQLDLTTRRLSAFGPEADRTWVHLIFARR